MVERTALCDVAPLTRLKPPLAQPIYIELGERSYGLALLFGYLRVFVPLPSSPERRGILASLDPISGEESFGDVDPIGPRDIPNVIGMRTALAHLQNMMDTLSTEAVLRGAKNKPELYIGNADFGQRIPLWWSSSTARYMFPKIPKK